MGREPTPQERQRHAFELLHEHAVTAHREGDGLRVAHLCETALQELERLTASASLLLSIHEVQWVFIFQFYWLTHGHTVHMSREVLRKLPRRSEQDEETFTLIECYAFFVEQPLMGVDAAWERLKTLPIKAFGAEATPETAELAVHLLELGWYHLITEDRWRQIAKTWSESGPAWLADLLRPVEERLVVQTRLTVPARERPPLTVNAAPELRKISDVAELWLLHLHGEAESIVARIEEINPRLNPTDYQWRLIADFWHTNPLLRSTDSENQGVWLARRRQMTTDFPILIFHDRRELRMRELLGELYRRDTVGSASQRWQALQLAMLHELAALRIWDFSMWREAAQAQSETLLEADQWMQAEPTWTAQGLVTGVRAMSLNPSKRDRLLRTAIQHMEFASKELLSGLSQDLFATYPRQKHTASELFDDIGDLVPSAQWEEYAAWVASYATGSRQKPTGGFKLNPLKTWEEIFPLVPHASTVWHTLQPEVIRLAADQHCWRGEEGYLLWSWLVSAPAQATRAVVDTLTGVSPGQAESFARARLVVAVENSRPELGHCYSEQLLPKATLVEERLLLARHLDDDSASRLEAQARTSTIEALRRVLVQAVPEEGANQFSFGSFVPGLQVIDAWDEQDEAILHELINAVSSPRVLRNWVPVLLDGIQSLVAGGPELFARTVLPCVEEWTERPLVGKHTPGEASGPFSIVQTSGISGGDIAGIVGWICVQLLRRLETAAHPVVRKWIEKTLFSGNLEPTAVALYCSIIIATQRRQGDNTTDLAAADAILLNLRIRMSDSPNASTALATSLRYIAGIVDAERGEIVNWGTKSGESTFQWLIDVLQNHAPLVAAAPDPDLRAGLAAVLWNLTKWYQLPDDLAALLQQLSVDRRARVRIKASGGVRELIRRHNVET